MANKDTEHIMGMHSVDHWGMDCGLPRLYLLGPCKYSKSLSSFSFSENISQQEIASSFAQQARLSMWSFEQSCTAGNVLQKMHDKIAKRITSLFPLSLGLFHLIMGKDGAFYNEGRIYSWVICGKIVLKSLLLIVF